MSKHTPGPWVAEINPTISQGKQIAAYSEDGNRAMQVIVSSFNMAEDMDLIAAAPDLLEALRQMVAMFDNEIHNEYDGTSMLADRLAEADFARAVIAKATGETK